jgi:hypothetical protein
MGSVITSAAMDMHLQEINMKYENSKGAFIKYA